MRAHPLALILLTAFVAGCAKNDDEGSAPLPEGYPQRNDTKSFTLAPSQSIEWKFRLDEGGRLEYSWNAGRPVYFDFHGDFDDGTDKFVSHKEATLASDRGSLTAPFDGRHGWYFSNGNSQTVTITLTTKGNYELVGRTGGNAP